MATRADLRTSVRRDLHDQPKPGEQRVDLDPSLSVYPIPNLGAILGNTVALDIDGNTVAPASYTFFPEVSYVQFNAGPPAGSSLHAVFQWGQWADEELNQFIAEAVREFSVLYPKENTRRRTAKSIHSATVVSQYNPGDASINISSTVGYDPIGIVTLGSIQYYYSSVDATHLNGIQVWVGDAAKGDLPQAIGTVVYQDDSQNHGWFYDPNVVRYVFKLRGFEPKDAFGAGMGYNDISWWSFSESNGYLQLDFPFGIDLDIQTGPDQLEVTTGEYYIVPNDDVTLLDIPDYAINPITWLAAAIALEAREPDRDMAFKDGQIVDVQGNPPNTLDRSAATWRKKWESWVKTQYRPQPRRGRKIFVL